MALNMYIGTNVLVYEILVGAKKKRNILTKIKPQKKRVQVQGLAWHTYRNADVAHM